MQITTIVDENFSEIAEKAAELGIDFSKARHLIDGRGGWKNKNIPVLDKKYAGKVSLESSISKHGNLVITFSSLKLAGISVSWSSSSSCERSAPRIYVKAHKKSKSPRRFRKKGERKQETFEQFYEKWKACNEWTDSSEYMQRKGIAGRLKLKYMSDWAGKFVAFPMMDINDKIQSFQKLYDNGKKIYLAKPKKGLFFQHGEVKTGEETIWLGEGLATVDDVKNATDDVGIIAFDCHNLEPVYSALKRKYPNAKFKIAADNDFGNKAGNAGMLAALELSYKHNLPIRYPTFTKEAIAKHLETNEKPPSDFNDLKMLCGMDEVKKQLKSNKLRAERSALGYNIQRLEHSGDPSKAKYKQQLRRVVDCAIRKNLTVEHLTQILPDCSAETIAKEFKEGLISHQFRVKRFHQITPGKYEYVNYEKLDLKREDHGGYTIADHVVDRIRAIANGIFIINSPMGSQKTEKIIKKLFEEIEFCLYLAHRIGLTEEAAKRLGIYCYRNIDPEMMPIVKKLATCLNSLNHPMFDKGEYFKDFGCVAIDEASKVFDHLCGGTVEDQEGILETLKNILQTAGIVVLTDADASDHLIEQVKILAPERRITVFSTDEAPMDHVKVRLSTNRNIGYQYIIKNSQENKKVLVALDSKSQSDNLARTLKKHKLKVLCINSDTKSYCTKVGAWVVNPNIYSQHYDVVIYTSAVDSGVSIVCDHFDLTVGIFRGVITPDSIVQMMGRNRRAREWFLVSDPINKTIYGNSAEARFKALTAMGIKVAWDEDNKHLIEVPTASDLDKITVSNEIRKTKLKQDFTLTLEVMLKQKGYQVSREESCSKQLKKIKDLMKAADEERVNELVEDLLSVDAPDDVEYFRLKSRYTITKEQAFSIKRYEIENSLGKKDLTEKDILFSLENYGRKDLVFELLHTPQDKLLEYDQAENKVVKSLKKRRFLSIKGELLKKLVAVLSLDLNTGSGMFTHHEARKFIDYLLENEDRRISWNELNLGPYLGKAFANRCPTTFIKNILQNMGLKTVSKKRTRKKLSFQSIDPKSWEVMMYYKGTREESGKNVAKIPRSFSDLIDREPEPTMTEEDRNNPLYKNGGTYGIDICAMCNNPSEKHILVRYNGKCEECMHVIYKLNNKTG